MAETILNNLSRLVLGKFQEEMPSEELALAKLALLDYLGVTMLGSRELSVNILLSYKLKYFTKGTTGTHQIIGKNVKLNQLDAVEFNGSSAHALDYDDTGASTQCHPSALLFPALISISEDHNISGKKLLKSYIIGVEMLNVLSKCLPFLHSNGWHPSSVFGPLASAVSSSLLLDSSEKQLANSLGIAASLSGGLVANFGSQTKHLHIGNASASGLKAALLGKGGFTSSEFILEGPKSYFAAYGKNDICLQDFLPGFGDPWSIKTPGLNFKQYASCALSHRLIDIAIDLKRKNDISPSEITGVSCRATPRAKEILFYQDPEEGLQGKFSIHYLIARALIYGEIKTVDFTIEAVNDPKVKNLMKLISFEVHEDWDDSGNLWRPDVLQIDLADGNQLEGVSTYPKGHAKNPFEWDIVQQKFIDCSEWALSRKSISNVISLVGTFEDIDDSSQILKSLQVE